MAGNWLRGGKRDITVVKRSDPTYPAAGGGNKKIHKESEATVKTALVPPGRIKIGLRVKQDERVDVFQMIGKNNTGLPLTRQPPNDAIAQDLAAALGVAADEQWVTYVSDTNYDPSVYSKKFATTIELNPFVCGPNGVRVLLIAATYHALTFRNDHYVYGVSILPGENSQGFAIDLMAKPKAAAKKPPKPKKK